MKNWKFFLIPVLLIVVLGAGAFLLSHQTPPLKGLQVGTPAQILDYAASLKSPLVLVNFWASWCEPCKKEFPGILTLRERYRSRGFDVIFVSIDENSDRDAAEKFLNENRVDFPSFFRGEQSLRFVNEIFPKWSGAIPMSLLLGPDQKVLEAWEGDTSLEEFEVRVKRHLESP